MLRSLHIRNLALIDELEVSFGPGLNVLTGETGAGKSIIVGALELLLGTRASTDMVRTGTNKAVVEGIFTADETVQHSLTKAGFEAGKELIVRREIRSEGSRAFLNDSPATLQVLSEIMDPLVDLHGQHDHQSLLRSETHLPLLDGYAEVDSLRHTYTKSYKELSVLRAEEERLLSKRSTLEQNRELAAFQIEEIDGIAPEAGEEEKLEKELKILDHIERLAEESAAIFDQLYDDEHSLYDRLGEIIHELNDLAHIEDSLAPFVEDLRSAHVTVSEAANFLRDYGDNLEYDPDRVEHVRERLGDFDRLKRKYGGSIEAVLEHRERIGQLVQEADTFDERLVELRTRIHAVEEKASLAARELSKARCQAAERLAAEVEEELVGLGMSDASYEVELTRIPAEDGWLTHDSRRVEAYPDGADRCRFLISTNRGEPPKPLTRVASGGEISRVMLGLKSILARIDRVDTLIFDEIDTGISGKIAQKVGHALYQLSRHHQVVSITHLPQIAAMADHHYLVHKIERDGRTTTGIRRLDEARRVKEVATLLSGSAVSDAAMASARELMASRP